MQGLFGTIGIACSKEKAGWFGAGVRYSGDRDCQNNLVVFAIKIAIERCGKPLGPSPYIRDHTKSRRSVQVLYTDDRSAGAKRGAAPSELQSFKHSETEGLVSLCLLSAHHLS